MIAVPHNGTARLTVVAARGAYCGAFIAASLAHLPLTCLNTRDATVPSVCA
jgi:hypothetical protein